MIHPRDRLPAQTHMSVSRRPRIATLATTASTLVALVAVIGGCSDSEPGAPREAGEPGATAAAPQTPRNTSATPTPAPSESAPAPSPVPPSFDCDVPGLGNVETLICTDSALATLDVRLDSVWRVSLERARGTAMPRTWVDEMRAYQRRWSERRSACAPASDELAGTSSSDDGTIRQCAETAYRERIARLQADWALARTTAGPVFWVCGDDPANDFVTTHFATDPEAVRVERGDQSEVFLQTPSASGARYEGTSGKSFWDRGTAASFVWPEGETRICTRRN